MLRGNGRMPSAPLLLCLMLLLCCFEAPQHVQGSATQEAATVHAPKDG